jgi:hypothetical protein
MGFLAGFIETIYFYNQLIKYKEIFELIIIDIIIYLIIFILS